MSISLFLLPTLLLALRSHSYALPNPQAASITPAPATGAAAARLASATPFVSDLSDTDFADFTSDLFDYTVGSAELVSQSKAYASATAAFYATAKPSDIKALSAARKEQSEEWAAWTSELYRTPGASELAALSSDYRQYTSELKVWETYTGTGDPFNSSATGTPFNSSATGSVPAQITASASATGAAANEPFRPLQRSQIAPAAYALTCLDSSASEMSEHTLQFSDCTQTIQAICDYMTGDVANRNQWVWSAKGGKCAMGYWLPAGSAIPSSTECQANIFDRMRRTCIPVNSQGGRWNAASVNVAVVPSGDSSGQQVDAGKASFLMAGSPYPCGAAGCKMIDS